MQLFLSSALSDILLPPCCDGYKKLKDPDSLTERTYKISRAAAFRQPLRGQMDDPGTGGHWLLPLSAFYLDLFLLNAIYM